MALSNDLKAIMAINRALKELTTDAADRVLSFVQQQRQEARWEEIHKNNSVTLGAARELTKSPSAGHA